MDSFKLFLCFSFLFFFLHPSGSHQGCLTGCGSTVPMHFPFQLIAGGSENRCGYPGFTVTCENGTQKILSFPFSDEFKIEHIDYSFQVIKLSDPDGCTAGRLLRGFNYSDTPFQPLVTQNSTFFNCTSDPSILLKAGIMPISCLSAESHSVVVVSTDESSDFSQSFNCTKIKTILYPNTWEVALPVDYITLSWKEPDCAWCESSRGICQFKSDVGLDVMCLIPFDPDFAENVKYAAIFVAASGLCVIGLIICIRCKIKHYGQFNPEISNSTNAAPGVMAAKGLDRPAIETYPTTVLGESLELPKSTESVCPICLIEYQAKETLRTIPSCMHYFHAECIDEWLKRNATCPLCRN